MGAADEEHVGGEVRRRYVGVGGDDLGQRPPVVDPVPLPDQAQARVVEVEEPVAVAQRLELLAPDRPLEFAEVVAERVRFGDHADERVDVGHRAVDRLEPRGERGSAVAADGLALGLVGAERDPVAGDVEQAGELHAVRVVDLVAAGQLRVGREGLARLTGDRPEGRLRCEAVRRAELVVAGHAVVTAALDVDRAEVHDAAEALRQFRAVQALRVARHRDLEQDAAQLVVDLLVVLVLGLQADALQQRAELELGDQVGVEERHVQRYGQLDVLVLDGDLDALRLQSRQLCRRVARGLGLELQLTVDHAVRAVADGRELVAERRC